MLLRSYVLSLVLLLASCIAEPEPVADYRRIAEAVRPACDIYSYEPSGCSGYVEMSGGRVYGFRIPRSSGQLLVFEGHGVGHRAAYVSPEETVRSFALIGQPGFEMLRYRYEERWGYS